ncbi:Homocysteine S-methyltransferase 1 [Cichlidogyrus casuarinus]|uniref:Homocysteine S-methyltransferase 1 n=1 Tax=Cichlidogyrus casuarinus TaxID=1844966 RepID=A0ABD2PY39_9PLAT
MVAPVDNFGNATYGFALLEGIIIPISWIFILVTLITEHKTSLPSTPSRGHGLILLLCWLGNFVLINLPLISIESPSWWWRLNKSSDFAEFSIWLIQYVCSLFVFLIGIKAPGLPNYALHYAHLNAESGESGTRRINYKLYMKRFKFLLPFIWPKSHVLLQLRVLICILLLVAGRVANLYTPIFYKELGFPSCTLHDSFKNDSRMSLRDSVFPKLKILPGLSSEFDDALVNFSEHLAD